MYTPNKQTISPEFDLRNPVRGGDSASVSTGTIVFSRPTSIDGPKDTIRRAIAGGDTTEKRHQQFQEAMTFPEQK